MVYVPPRALTAAPAALCKQNADGDHYEAGIMVGERRLHHWSGGNTTQTGLKDAQETSKIFLLIVIVDCTVWVGISVDRRELLASSEERLLQRRKLFKRRVEDV